MSSILNARPKSRPAHTHPPIGHSGAATRIPKLAIADNGFDRTLTLERPALTADKSWRAVKVKGLKVEVLR